MNDSILHILIWEEEKSAQVLIYTMFLGFDRRGTTVQM